MHARVVAPCVGSSAPERGWCIHMAGHQNRQSTDPAHRGGVDDGTSARMATPVPGPVSTPGWLFAAEDFVHEEEIRDPTNPFLFLPAQRSLLESLRQVTGLAGQPQIFWGVDSLNPANLRMGKRQTLFDYVTRQTGQAPTFWGRYIGRKSGSITSEEADFLHARDCRILVIFPGTKLSPRSVLGGYPEGESDAKLAIDAARAAGVRPGVWIYANIDYGFHATTDFFRGWSDTMVASEYGGAGGVYLDPGALEGKNYCSAYQVDEAMRGQGRYAAYVWSYQPSLPKASVSAAAAPIFKPKTLACNAQSVIWQYTIDRLKRHASDQWGLVDENLATFDGLWSMW